MRSASRADAQLVHQLRGPVVVEVVVLLAPPADHAVRRGHDHVADQLVARDALGEGRAGETDPGAQLEDVDGAEDLAEDPGDARRWGGSVPSATCTSVVLPAPLGPRMTQRSSSSTVQSTSSSRVASPRRTVTPANCRTGSIAPSSPGLGTRRRRAPAGRPQPTARAAVPTRLSARTPRGLSTSRLDARGRRDVRDGVTPVPERRDVRCPSAGGGLGAFRAVVHAWCAGRSASTRPGTRSSATTRRTTWWALPGRDEPRAADPGPGRAPAPSVPPGAGLALPEPGRPARAGRSPVVQRRGARGRRGGRAARASDLGLVPVRAGAGVVWRCLPARRGGRSRTWPRPTPSCARTLPRVADALADLDVARWRPEVADELMALRRRDPWRCRPGPTRGSQRDAWRWRRGAGTIVELALADDGGAVTAAEADRPARGAGAARPGCAAGPGRRLQPPGRPAQRSTPAGDGLTVDRDPDATRRRPCSSPSPARTGPA